MTSKVNIRGFGSDAEVLMVLFNSAGVGTRGSSLRPMMGIKEAKEHLSTTPQLITGLHDRELMLFFDGSDIIDCTEYEVVNHVYPGYAQEMLDAHLMATDRQLMTAAS